MLFTNHTYIPRLSELRYYFIQRRGFSKESAGAIKVDNRFYLESFVCFRFFSTIFFFFCKLHCYK